MCSQPKWTLVPAPLSSLMASLLGTDSVLCPVLCHHCLASWILWPVLWSKGQIFRKSKGQELSQERESSMLAEYGFAVSTPQCCVVTDKPLPSLSRFPNYNISLMNYPLRAINNGRWGH